MGGAQKGIFHISHSNKFLLSSEICLSKLKKVPKITSLRAERSSLFAKEEIALSVKTPRYDEF